MSEILTNITDARNNGTINVYAVRYKQRERVNNVAVALPGNESFDFRHDFCDNVIRFEKAREVPFNPMSNGLNDETYEYIPLTNVAEKWEELTILLNEALNYHGAENRKKVAQSNLYIGVLDYNKKRYYLCAKQGKTSENLFKGKCVFFSNQDELQRVDPDEVFFMSSYVGFIISPSENKVLILDKNAFQDVFKYDDYQKKNVKRNITIVDQWNFLESTQLIKEKCSQKNVYGNLAKVFADQKYMKQIQATTPEQLKNNLLTNSPDNFTQNDFKGNLLVVTPSNLDVVMKMLGKGFRFNFFTNSAEQL